MTSSIYLCLFLLIVVLWQFVTKKFTEPLTSVPCVLPNPENATVTIFTHTRARKPPQGLLHLCRYSHGVQRTDRGQKECMEIQRRKIFKFKEFQNELHVFWNVAAYCAICHCIYCGWRPSFDYQNTGKILSLPKNSTEHQYFTITFISQGSREKRWLAGQKHMQQGSFLYSHSKIVLEWLPTGKMKKF